MICQKCGQSYPAFMASQQGGVCYFCNVSQVAVHMLDRDISYIPGTTIEKREPDGKKVEFAA